MKKSVLPYRQLMTPQWIENNAVITGPYELNPQYFQISQTSGVSLQRALQIQLVPPGILKANDSISVTVILAMDTALADSTDHDFIHGISDNTSFVGFILADKDNYNFIPPCEYREGDKGDAVLLTLDGSNGPPISDITNHEHYSGEVKMQFRPTEQWGSCHTEHIEGYTNIVNYQHLLDLTSGLYLEMYRDEVDEIYRIKYIAVDVELD